MAVLSPTTINQRVRIQGYKTKEGRNYFAVEQLVKNQIVSTTREFEIYWQEFKNQQPQLALAFILLAWNHTIEHKIDGTLFSPFEAKNFLDDPINFLNIISYPWDKVRRDRHNPFNRTTKWPD